MASHTTLTRMSEQVILRKIWKKRMIWKEWWFITKVPSIIGNGCLFVCLSANSKLQIHFVYCKKLQNQFKTIRIRHKDKLRQPAVVRYKFGDTQPKLHLQMTFNSQLFNDQCHKKLTQNYTVNCRQTGKQADKQKDIQTETCTQKITNYLIS